jgi:hypothetical protein
MAPRAANAVGLTALGEASPKPPGYRSDEDSRAISGPLAPVTSGLSRPLADRLIRRSGHVKGPDGTDSQADSGGSIPGALALITSDHDTLAERPLGSAKQKPAQYLILEDLDQPVEHGRTLTCPRRVQLGLDMRPAQWMTFSQPQLKLANGLLIPEVDPGHLMVAPLNRKIPVVRGTASAVETVIEGIQIAAERGPPALAPVPQPDGRGR